MIMLGNCPAGFRQISVVSECQDAAAALNVPFAAVSEANSISDCYSAGHNPPTNIFYNTDTNADNADKPLGRWSIVTDKDIIYLRFYLEYEVSSPSDS